MADTATLDADERSDRQSRYRVPAVDKALDILELLAAESDGLPMAALAERLGRTISEIYRTVQQLEMRGYIERSLDGDRYSITMKLFQLAHAAPRVRSLASRALPIMEKLAFEIEQSCHLAVLEGLDILIVAQVDSPLPRYLSVRMGARMPIWEASSGNLLVSQLPEEKRNALLRSMTHILAPELLDQFRQRVAEAAATAREQRESFIISGLITICRPVYDHLDTVVAAMSVPFLHNKRLVVTADEAAERLGTAAERLSYELGHRGRPHA